jgi:hypothetical protein
MSHCGLISLAYQFGEFRSNEAEAFDQSRTGPQFGRVEVVNQHSGLRDSFCVIRARQWRTTSEMPVASDTVSSVLGHCFYPYVACSPGHPRQGVWNQRHRSRCSLLLTLRKYSRPTRHGARCVAIAFQIVAVTGGSIDALSAGRPSTNTSMASSKLAL